MTNETFGQGTRHSRVVRSSRYHESLTGERTEVATRSPVCFSLEISMRCNFRTDEELEPPAGKDCGLFTSIVGPISRG